MSDDQIRRLEEALETIRGVLAAGGKNKDAAAALNISDSALSAAVASLGLGARTQRSALDWNTIFASRRPRETAIDIGRRVGRDTANVTAAARIRGIVLPETGNKSQLKGINWDAELATAINRGERTSDVSRRLKCSEASVRGAAKQRRVRLRGMRRLRS